MALFGEVSEWLKEHAWKACVGLRPPRVRIPVSPHITATIKFVYAHPGYALLLKEMSRWKREIPVFP